MVSEISTEDKEKTQIDPVSDKKCLFCGGNLHIKFADQSAPISWCPECMVGTGEGEAEGISVDMHVFQSAITQRVEILKERKKKSNLEKLSELEQELNELKITLASKEKELSEIKSSDENSLED